MKKRKNSILDLFIKYWDDLHAAQCQYQTKGLVWHDIPNE